MPRSRTLAKHWRNAPDVEIRHSMEAARASVAAFGEATQAAGSLIQSWTQGAEVSEHEHYPTNDLIDHRSGYQCYYHAHRDRGLEHGHLHLFWHATINGRRRRAGAGNTAWVRTAPTHLLAVSLDARGEPVGLFTVNRWVTEGHWFDAATTMSFVDHFSLVGDAEHAHSCRWLTAFIAFYRPQILPLLQRRDARLEKHADCQQAQADRTLEILSAQRLDWAADLDCIEAEWLKRRL